MFLSSNASQVTVIGPALLVLADTLAAAVTWRTLHKHRAREEVARCTFSSIVLWNGTLKF